jgi:hypothetical protein
VEKRSVCKKVERMDEEGHSTMYVLLRCWAYENLENGKETTFPFTPVSSSKKEVTYNLDSFPPQLQRLLLEFANMNLKKIEERSEIKED